MTTPRGVRNNNPGNRSKPVQRLAKPDRQGAERPIRHLRHAREGNPRSGQAADQLPKQERHARCGRKRDRRSLISPPMARFPKVAVASTLIGIIGSGVPVSSALGHQDQREA